MPNDGNGLSTLEYHVLLALASGPLHGYAIKDAVADKGYHSNDMMVDLKRIGIRSYTAEPERGTGIWRGRKSGGPRFMETGDG